MTYRVRGKLLRFHAVFETDGGASFRIVRIFL